MKYHIGKKGDPVICKAKEGNCPLKNSDDSPVQHFDSKQDAIIFLEKINNSVPQKIVKNSSYNFNSTIPVLSLENQRKLVEEMIVENKRIVESNEKYDHTLAYYSMVGYEPINGILRSGDDFFKNHKNYQKYPLESFDNLRRVVDKHTVELDNIQKQFGSGKDKPVKELYRYQYINGSISEYVKNNFVVSEDYVDHGFVSTTEDPAFVVSHIANRSAKKRNRISDDENNYLVFRMLSSKGISLQSEIFKGSGTYRVQQVECERLLPRDLRFKVDNISEMDFRIDKSRNDLKQVHKLKAKDFRNKKFLVVDLIDNDLV